MLSREVIKNNEHPGGVNRRSQRHYQSTRGNEVGVSTITRMPWI